jgi:hypothetical protein
MSALTQQQSKPGKHLVARTSQRIRKRQNEADHAKEKSEKLNLHDVLSFSLIVIWRKILPICLAVATEAKIRTAKTRLCNGKAINCILIRLTVIFR